MVSDILGMALVPAYLLVLGLVAVRYRRGKPIPTATSLNYAVDGLSVVVLPVGPCLCYRWWRERDGGDGTAPTSG